MAADLRDGLRRARRTPGFALVMILTLGLALGATITVVSLLNALSLRDLSVPAPDELVAVAVTDPRGGRATFYAAMANTLALRVQSLSSASNYNCCGLLELRVGSEAGHEGMGVVSPGYFDVLGIRPALGRFFTAADYEESGVVIAYDVWRRRFASDPNVIGRTVTIGAATAVVIGVAPADFKGLNIDSGMEMAVLSPLANRISSNDLSRPRTTGSLVGRVKRGVSLKQAEAEIAAVWPSVRDASVPVGLSPDAQRAVLEQRVQLVSIRNGFSNLRLRYDAGLRMLAALSFALLAVATINLGGLSLARLKRKRGELAVRLALGASRARLMRSLVAEHLLLSIVGAAAGTGLAWLLCGMFAGQVWAGAGTMLLSVTPDVRVLIVAAMLAVISGALVSLVPCWVIVRRDIATLDRPALTAGRHTARAARGLLAVQTAVAMALACVTLLFAKSALQLVNANLGFDTADVVIGRITTRTGGYRDFEPRAYYPALVARLEQLPGVRSAALSKILPSPLIDLKPVALRGQARGKNEVVAAFDTISPRFFETMGIRLLHGRGFDWRDDIRTPGVTVVSAGLATQLFGSTAAAVGQRVRIGEDAPRADLEVVGVVNDIRHLEFRTAPQPAIYRPWLQEPSVAIVPLFLLKRPDAQLATTLRDVRSVVDELAREAPPLAASRLEDMVARGQLRERLLGEVSAGVGALALLLTFLGLTALMLQAVASRTREIGLRKALGATDGGLARGIAFDACRLVLVGIALGVPLAIAGGRMARALLVDVSPYDPAVVAGVVGMFLLVAVAASLLPAFRAARVDPIVALRAH